MAAKKKDLVLILSFDDKGSVQVKKVVSKVKGELGKLGKSARDTSKGFDKMKEAVDDSSKGMSKLKGMIKSTFMQMAMGMGIMMGVQAAMRAIKQVISGIIQVGREFEREWANVTTMLTISKEETNKMRKALIALSPTLGDTTDLAKGMYQVLSASIEPAKAVMFLGEAAKSAKAGVTDIATAVDALTTVINAYGMEAEEVTKVSDIMFQTVKRGKLTYAGMAGALGTVIPMASAVGLKFEDVAAAMATLTRQGIEVNTTTVQLRGIMVGVLKPTSDAIRVAKRLGIEFSATALKAKGLSGFLADIKERTKGDVEALSALFGNVRALTGVMALGGGAAAEFASDLALMKTSAGTTSEAFEKQMSTMDAWIEVIENSLSKMKISFYEGFITPFKSGIKTSEDLEVRVRVLTLQAEKLGLAFGKTAKVLKEIFGFIADAGKTGGFVGAIARKFSDLTFEIVGMKTPTEKITEAQLKWMEQNERTAASVKKLEKSIHGSGVVTAMEELLVVGKKVKEMMKTGLDVALAWANMQFFEKTIVDVAAALEKEMGRSLHNLTLETVLLGMELSSNFIYALEELSKKSGIAADVLKEKFLKQFEKLIKAAKETKAFEDAAKYFEEFKGGAKKLGVVLDMELRSKLADVTDYMIKFRSKLSPRELKELAKKAVALANKLGQELSPSMMKLAQDIKEVKKESTGWIRVMDMVTEAAKIMKEKTVLLGLEFAPELTTKLKRAEAAYVELMEAGKLSAAQQVTAAETVIDLHSKLGKSILLLPPKYLILSAMSRRKMPEVIADVEELGNVWSGINEQIEADWIRLFSTLITEPKSFLDRFKSVTDGIVKMWADAIGNIILEGAKAGKSFKEIGSDVKGFALEGEGLIGAIIALSKAFAGLLEEAGLVTTDFGKKMGQTFGGISGIIGDVVAKLFGFKSAAEKAAEAAKRLEARINWLIKNVSKWGDITESTAEAINESSKNMAGFAAVSKHYADVLRDVGITQKSISAQWIKAGDIIHHITEGYLNMEDGVNALEDSFGLLLASARKFGTEGSEAMVAFILKLRESGIEIQAVTDYVMEQLNKIPSALATMVRNAKKKGFDKLGAIAKLTFEAMIAEGMSYMETLEALKDPLSALIEKYEEMGRKLPDYLQPIADLMGLMELKPAIFENLDSALTVLNSLRNSAYLTQDAFNTLSQSASQFARTILDVKGNLNAALKSMDLTTAQIQQLLPMVAQFVGAAAIFGLTIPAWMKTFVTQQLGVDWESFKDIVKTQAGAGITTVEKLTKLIDTALPRQTESLRNKLDHMGGYLWDKLEHARRDIYSALGGVVDAIGKASNGMIDSGKESPPTISAQGGWEGMVTRPVQRFEAHRGEHVKVTPAGEEHITVYIEPIVIPKEDEYIIEFIQKKIEKGGIRIPLGAVGG